MVKSRSVLVNDCLVSPAEPRPTFLQMFCESVSGACCVGGSRLGVNTQQNGDPSNETDALIYLKNVFLYYGFCY